MRYGIRYSTIRYFQAQALSLYRTNGVYAGRGTLEARKEMSAQMIGHAIIELATVASPEHLKAVLTGSRGNRWR